MGGSGSLYVEPLAHPPAATVRVPGSKSITNRALVLAALTAKGEAGPCELRGCLHSEDTEVMIAALQRLGFRVAADWHADGRVTVHSATGPLIPAASADLYVANSGTTMRFLTAMVCLGRGRYRLHGVPRMHERPIGDLLDALGQLGVRAFSEAGNGRPPVVVEADGLKRGGEVRVMGNVSSQFLSGLLLIAPFADYSVDVAVEGPLVSEPYIEMTAAMLRQWGTYFDAEPGPHFHFYGRPPTGVTRYAVEPDASAASYFFAAAAVTGGSVTVPGLTIGSLQGDVRFVEVLEEMGCTMVRGREGLTVHGGPLRGVDVDMNAISDTALTLAAVACFADGPTTIRNVAHIRHKETDRLHALATELRRLGARIDERADGLTITPGPLFGTEVETYDDHRMAMSLAVVGLRVPGVGVRNPGCVAKTYPGFFADLDRLRE